MSHSRTPSASTTLKHLIQQIRFELSTNDTVQSHFLVLYHLVLGRNVCCQQQILQETDFGLLHPLHQMISLFPPHPPTALLLHPGTDALFDIWCAEKETMKNVNTDKC